MKRAQLKLIAWILLLMISVSTAAALGIMPAKTDLSSDETKEYSGTMFIVNNDKIALDIKISVEGPLKDFITVDAERVTLAASDENKMIRFEVKLPDALPPGEQVNYIVVEQQLDSVEQDVVSSRIRLKHKLTIQGPYPDKFVTVDVRFLEQENTVSMTAELVNKGKEGIDSVKTTFFINDKEQKQRTLETESASLKVDERKLLKTEIGKGLLGQGEFEVKAVTLYDDLTVEVIKTMVVGKPEVDITYFDSIFRAYGINEYSMDLLNNWNKPVENVFVDVSMKKDDKVVDTFRTKSVDLEATATKRLNDYLDAENDAPGTYSFDMIVNFWNTYKMDTKTFSAELLSEAEYNKIKGKSSESASGTPVWVIVVITVVVMLLLVVIVVFVMFMRKGGAGPAAPAQQQPPATPPPAQ